MNDFFYEQLLPVKLDFKKKLQKAVVWMALIVLFFIALLFLGSFGIVIGIILIYLAISFVFPKFKLEYEYVITNGHLQIAAIYQKSTRKDLYECSLRDAELIAPASYERLKGYHNAKRLFFASAEEHIPYYTLVVRNNADINLVTIQPDEKMKDLLKRGAGGYGKFIS